MRKDVEKIIEIPEGVAVTFNAKEFTVKSGDKELKKEINLGKVEPTIEGNQIKLVGKKATKRELTTMGTVGAHLRNMIEGVQNEFTYKLEVCNVHFPMNVKLEGDIVRIKSFLGEKIDRTSKVLPNVKVDIKGSVVTVSSPNIEAAGQTAANLEQATKVKGRDRRIFQDGIFITEKPRRVI